MVFVVDSLVLSLKLKIALSVVSSDYVYAVDNADTRGVTTRVISRRFHTNSYGNFLSAHGADFPFCRSTQKTA